MADDFEHARRQLPPKVVLAGVLRRRTLELCSYLAREAGRDENSFVSLREHDTPAYPVQMGEIDRIKPYDFIDEPEDSLSIFGFRLFGDGSPFMFDLDLDLIGGTNTHVYELVCLSELPPFIVNSARIEERSETRPALDGVREYLEDVTLGRQPAPYYLRDDEAAQFIDLLNNPELEGFIDTAEPK